ncbi:hypothetical protein BJY04DRAFT_224120 [Aspergillus karnatakaensis]|uniref:uncharacterized protein n=1 Tax=Aspergillus karnatakaensis TaxID=1810916 RepID=UPI003CCDDDFB
MHNPITLLACLLCLSLAVVNAAIVPVYWHVFYDQNYPSDGNIPDTVLTQAINVAKSYFTQINVEFQIQGINRRPAPYSILHSHYAIDAHSRTFPWDYTSRPTHDGIIIDHSYLPGGPHPGYNTGKILVTAIGGWSDLYNTHEGGCDGVGDHVDDTPAAAHPATGCPRGLDTCPGGGADPIDNLVSFTDEYVSLSDLLV